MIPLSSTQLHHEGIISSLMFIPLLQVSLIVLAFNTSMYDMYICCYVCMCMFFFFSLSSVSFCFSFFVISNFFFFCFSIYFLFLFSSFLILSPFYSSSCSSFCFFQQPFSFTRPFSYDKYLGINGKAFDYKMHNHIFLLLLLFIES